MIRISLLHATYRRPGGPLEVRDAWLERAIAPETIEYVVAMDADDATAVATTAGLRRIFNPASPSVTAVRNWNAAAAAAEGDLLVVIADDLFPPEGWDRRLLEMIGSLNPARTPFAVKLADAPDPKDTLLRHPVISRAYFREFGLFSPAFRGMYCDRDLTTRAYWRSVILDGRSLQLEHRHPNIDGEVSDSASQVRMNRSAEYRHGADRYRATWSRRKRAARVRLVSTASTRNLTHFRLAVIQRWLRTGSNLECVGRALVRVARLLSQPEPGRGWAKPSQA